MSSSSPATPSCSPGKRTFDEIIFPSSPCLRLHHAHYAIAAHEAHQRQHYIVPYSPSKRRSSQSRSNSMLAESHSIMSESFPSFMSVFGSEESDVYRPVHLDHNQAKADQDAFLLMTRPSPNTQAPQQHFRHHNSRGSITSLFSESAESSPTTTNSTFDSPLVSANTSASSSPESATSLAPATSFRATPVTQSEQPISNHESKHQPVNTSQTHTMQDTTKNVKKLTLDVDLTTLQPRPATAHATDAHPLSAPSSPLKEPLKSARKKPTNLTIRTPGYNQLTFPRTGNIPATPNNRPSLHQYQSSPALSSLASPRGPPAGGMFLPLPSLNTQQTNSNSSSSNRNSFLANSMPDLREETDNLIPKSQEAPERGYTEGPVCIYDCGVYLYLEPTAEEAMKFDTVINVAKEIRNPFKEQSSGEGTVMSVWRADQGKSNRNSIIEPQTAISEYSFKSAWEWPQSGTATTPTQSSFAFKSQEPEYLHVRWDHNSEILEDLYPLCKHIDDRVNEGKKVLIHCQLGVSRSASLIIAYGLFKNYQQNFHAMYTAVKERSRWVGPNMSLIYQLTDFKSRLNRGDYANGSKPLRPEWSVKSPIGPPTPVTTESAPSTVAENHTEKAIEPVASQDSAKPKRTAPLRLNKALPPVPLFPKNEQRTQTPPIPGAFPTQTTPTSTTTVKRAASRPLPFRERNMEMSIPEHRPRIRAGFALAHSPAVMDLAMKDVPSTPSLFSPRATEFMATPFGIRGAGDLETPGNRLSKEIPSGFNWLPLRKEGQQQAGHARTASKDPRSPHQQAEPGEIWRSIDDIL